MRDTFAGRGIRASCAPAPLPQTASQLVAPPDCARAFSSLLAQEQRLLAEGPGHSSPERRHDWFAALLCVLLVGTSSVAAANPLIDAVKRQSVDEVRALLVDNVDANAREGDGATALHWAASHDNVALVEMLLRAGAKPEAANDLGVTSLHLAAANASKTIVAALLDRGAPSDAATLVGVTPLMEAARVGHADIVKMLLARGASANVHERERRQTPLMWAAARGHSAVVRALIDAGASLEARSVARTVTVMLDRGPGREAKTAMKHASQIGQGGFAALHFAAQSGDVESATLLVEAGADLESRAADGNTPLVLATFAGQGAVARLLVERGANTNANGAGYTALHVAALRADLDTTKALLSRGADPNARLSRGSPVRRFASQWALPRTFTGATPLFIAAAYHEAAVVAALLASGATVDTPTESGLTPLLVAGGLAFEKEVRPTDLARWNIIDSDFPEVPTAPEDVAATVRLLADSGANVTAADANDTTALHVAASAGWTTVIQVLAERGARLDGRDKAGKTPLDLATPREDARTGRRSGSKEAEDLLRRLLSTRQ